MMERLLQTLVNGLSLGSLYTLVALGLVIAFRGSGHLNFAQGEIALFCAYVAWQLHDWGLVLWVAAALSMVVGFLLGGATEFLLVRPLGRQSPLAVFVATIAVFLGLNELDGAIWGGQAKPFDPLFKRPDEPDPFVRILGVELRWPYLGVLLVTLALSVAFFVLFRRTKAGLAMRAVSSNAESARLVGIRSSVVLTASWGLAASVGALGGVLVASTATNVSQVTMVNVFIAASAAATLGGFDSPLGAVVGGLTIGVIENMAAEYQSDWIGQDLRIAPALVLILVVLLVRPSGLFGSRRIERV